MNAYQVEQRAQKRSRLVSLLTTAMSDASDLGMYKTATRIRDNLLPLAHEDAACATVAECRTQANAELSALAEVGAA